VKQWLVAYSQHNKELTAKKHLFDQGFDVYLPRFEKTRRHARKIEKVLSPLFPRYLFVGVDLNSTGWRSINGTLGVSYLLMQGEQPAMIPESVIENLKSQEDQKEVVCLDSLVMFIRNDKVRVVEGIFEDQIGIFEKLDDKQRVQILLNFLGREITVSLPAYAVEAA
jgi:transcriptional antiterminator RfaH